MTKKSQAHKAFRGKKGMGKQPRDPKTRRLLTEDLITVGSKVTACVKVDLLGVTEEDRESLATNFVELDGVVQEGPDDDGHFRVQFFKRDNYDFVSEDESESMILHLHHNSLVKRKKTDPIYGTREFIAQSIVDKRKHIHDEYEKCPGGEGNECSIEFDFKIFWPKWPKPLCFTWEPFAGPLNDSNCPSNMVYEYLWRLESRKALKKIAKETKGGLLIHGIRPHPHTLELDFNPIDSPCFDSKSCNSRFDFLIGPGTVLPHLSSLGPLAFICVRDRDLSPQLRLAALANKFWNLTLPNENGDIESGKTSDLEDLEQGMWYRFAIEPEYLNLDYEDLPPECSFKFIAGFEWKDIKGPFKKQWFPKLNLNRSATNAQASTAAASSAPLGDRAGKARNPDPRPVGPDGCADKGACKLLGNPPSGARPSHSCGTCGGPLHGICGVRLEEGNEMDDSNRQCSFCHLLESQAPSGSAENRLPSGKSTPLCSKCHEYPVNPNDRNPDVTLCLKCIGKCPHKDSSTGGGTCGVSGGIRCDGSCGLIFCRTHIKDKVVDGVPAKLCFDCNASAPDNEENNSSGHDGDDNAVEQVDTGIVDEANAVEQVDKGNSLTVTGTADTPHPAAAGTEAPAVSSSVSAVAGAATAKAVLKRGRERRKARAGRASENKWEVREPRDSDDDADDAQETAPAQPTIGHKRSARGLLLFVL